MSYHPNSYTSPAGLAFSFWFLTFIMVDGNVITFNVAAFVSALFLLEFGADKFIDHTSIVARRTGIPDTVITLLTAGEEWEEVGSRPKSWATPRARQLTNSSSSSSLAQGRSSLAI